MVNIKKLVCWFVFFGLIANAQASFTEIVVFGSSSSSINGNIIGGAYDPDTWSNGYNWTEQFAQNFDISLAPSTTGGTNYATGGATTAVILGQISSYLSDVGNTANDNALYIMSGGGNDARLGLDLATAASNTRLGIENLIAAGADNFLVLNLPDRSLAPHSVSPPGGLSLEYNNFLSGELSNINGASNIFTLDIFALIHHVVANPATYGLTDVSDNCYDFGMFSQGTGALCSNPDEYLWWDIAHFTEAGNAIIADAAYSAVVPVPAALFLFGSGLMSVFGMRLIAKNRG